MHAFLLRAPKPKSFLLSAPKPKSFLLRAPKPKSFTSCGLGKPKTLFSRLLV